MWNIVWVAMAAFLLTGPGCTTGDSFKELGTDDILLLNVAVKGRLVERLTDSVTRLESARVKMVDFVKACFYNATSKTDACQLCVTEACEKRAMECSLDVAAIETISVQTKPDRIPEQQIPGVQFLTSPFPVEMGLEGFTKNAEEDILENVPSALRSQGKQLLQKAEGKLQQLQENLKNSVQELPGLIPRMRGAIESVSTDIDVESLMGVADKAADSISHVITDKNVNLAVTSVMEQMPTIVTQMNKKMQQLTSVMSSFVSNAVDHLGELMNTPIPVPVRSWVDSPDGQINASEDMAEPSSTSQRPRSRWVVKHFRLGGSSSGSAQGIFLSSGGFTRLKRSAVDCKDVSHDPQEACKAFHFQCAACMDNTAILKESCGKDSMRMMLAIKRVDMKAADYLMTYSKHIKTGIIVLKVKYDENNFDPRTSTYKNAYVTAKVRDEVVTYKTSSLPNLADLSTSGGEIGDEIWMILDEDEHTTDGVSKKLDKVAHDSGSHDHVTMGLKHYGTSDASTNSVVWGVVGFIMYLGLVAL
ncbi:uncharacterized protein LOC110465097 [Mizuhopecten yessoensis]|uniref:Uncharacterized protein n=1 Tax=Mizuhopecten yessoensis TaxID=6573 RepID=A0A210R295_MIZYE|nr:uncharacterized protein LOC110465097 [Mizuhopecten yessoensis]OWF55025.1 hypothetical protein KP79_PYT18965 [Mizuhopecten yessoensis]